jgi:hypothetical protein
VVLLEGVLTLFCVFFLSIACFYQQPFRKFGWKYSNVSGLVNRFISGGVLSSLAIVVMNRESSEF